MRVEQRDELGEIGEELIAEHRRMRGGGAALLERAARSRRPAPRP